MKPKKISHINDKSILHNDRKKRSVLELNGNNGRIVAYHPFKSMQIIFYDIHSNEIPDLWELGYRKGDSGRYLRTLLCKEGSCDFTINTKTNTLPAGMVMMDYSIGDDMSFCFTCEKFIGVEITMQVDTLVEESSMMKMLRLVIESMNLPEDDIFDSDGYLFPYSKDTEQTLNKLYNAGINEADGVMLLALTVAVGHNLGTDLKTMQNSVPSSDKQMAVAKDIHHCLTEDFGTKYTAEMFAEKYGVSDTTVKKYFKSVYGYGFKEYQTKIRMEWASKQLKNTDLSIGDISSAVGYSKQTKFSKAFKSYYGVTPSEYRRNSFEL